MKEIANFVRARKPNAIKNTAHALQMVSNVQSNANAKTASTVIW